MVLVLFLLLTFGPPLLMLRRARSVSADVVVDEWAAAHAVEVPAAARPVVGDHLVRLVRAQCWCAAVGWVVSPPLDLPFAPFSGAVIGYLVASLIVELRSRRPFGTGVALLVPRRLGDYVPGAAVTALRGTVALAIATAALAGVLEERASAFGPGRWGIVAIAVGAAVLALAVEVVARRVVTRPQPAGTEELLAVDDALRSTSVHEVVASGTALVLVVVAGGFAAVGGRLEVRPLGWLLGTATVLALLGAVAVWQWLSPRGWRVRRLDTVAP